MWHYPNIDAIAISLGPISIHWYALSYLAGIGLVLWTLNIRARTLPKNWNKDQISDLLFFGVLGVLLGGRFGYVIFYGAERAIADPVSILKIWQGGMSFHGGLVGVLLGMAYFAWTRKRRFFDVADFVAPSVPLALGCGRIGNFINTELPGRVTDVPWAVIFPGELIGRHPSSLYQAVLEGPVLFLILWMFAAQSRPPMAVSGLFLLGYGALRIISELFREPDTHLGYMMFESITRGQLLSIPMALIGIFLITYSYLSKNK